ncbi:RNA-directed DNA polymerase, eukaryota [Tanacetum coccineum]
MGDCDWTEVSRKKKRFIIGSQRSKEDEVQKLSTSVFVTNFPDLFNAKDLWNTCKQYGNVVDVPKAASNDLSIKGGVTWVRDCGIPLKMWSKNTFNRIASIWDTLLHVENQEDECYHRKRICINTNVKSNIFESFKAIYQGKVFWVRAKEIPKWVPDIMEDDNEESDMDDAINEEESNGEDVDFKKFSASEGDNENEVVPDSMFEDELHEIDGEEVYVGQNKANSEDPFNLYDLLNKKKDENNKGDCVEDSLKFPPEEDTGSIKKYSHEEKAKDDVVESMCPGHFQKPETPWSGGSILQSMDDMVKELTEKRFFHYWFDMEGFDKLVEESWKAAPIADTIAIIKMMKKLKYLKENIHKGEGDEDVVNKRANFDRSLQELEKLQSVEVAQKAKIKWAIKGDENSKYYHVSFIKVRKRGRYIVWEECLRGGLTFKYLFPEYNALESSKNIVVASKMAHCILGYSFRRDPRGSVEKAQFDSMLEKVEGTLLADMRDRWMLSLEGSGDFSVASVRKLLDGNMLPEVASKTRWIKVMPIKVNVHAWRVKLDCLPTRINIFRRGIQIESIICPMCGEAAKSSRHIFFSCHIAREILRKILRWWDVSYMELSSYEEWLDWIFNIRISVKHKQILEGVCYAMWWHI